MMRIDQAILYVDGLDTLIQCRITMALLRSIPGNEEALNQFEEKISSLKDTLAKILISEVINEIQAIPEKDTGA